MKFKIAETKTFQKEISKEHFKGIYRKITGYVYPLLRENPFFGPNIKRLKGSYSDFYRFRVGQYRIFYKIIRETITVYIVNIEHRKDVYR
ncbi:MAG: type II toxin-antitoxin system RelE/ParE family toxin [Spirochaetales bacterium]|jgi:mRNA interferase RelE/StbE|nr:type II toxin-antitoxin system RelE/ParE family toxin [Spirochaetales bacterium]